jgi:hypothetical protein
VSASTGVRSESTPARTGPVSRPTAATKFIVARAPTARPGPRTTWVWVPVKKQARAAPCSRLAMMNGARAAETVSSPLLAASRKPATVISVQSGQRRMAGPRLNRVASWATAETAVTAPISAAE